MVDEKKLAGVWFHSHEEDQADRVVYRPTSYELPRSRAPRESLTIDPSGSCTFGGPGPADASTSETGTWQATGDELTLLRAGRKEVYEIVSLDDDALVLRRRERGNGDGGHG